MAFFPHAPGNTVAAWRAPLLASVALLLLLTSHASAQEVAVLPVTTRAKELRIYRNAIPAALASELTTRLGVTVKAVPSATAVSKETRVLVDGRLVTVTGDLVQLDVVIRRASTGRRVATISSGVAAITDVDRIVGQVATSLIPALQKARSQEPIQLPTTIVRGTVEKGASPEAGPAKAPKPHVLLLPAHGEAAKGMVEVREPATHAAAHMLSRYGLVVAHSRSHATTPNPVAAVAEMRSFGAPMSMMVRVVSVDFAFSTVLAAKGRVRVVLMGQDGLAILDTTVTTDTVVGSRGDRHQALVYGVAEQALDMAAPKIVRTLQGRGV